MSELRESVSVAQAVEGFLRAKWRMCEEDNDKLVGIISGWCAESYARSPGPSLSADEATEDVNAHFAKLGKTNVSYAAYGCLIALETLALDNPEVVNTATAGLLEREIVTQLKRDSSSHGRDPIFIVDLWHRLRLRRDAGDPKFFTEAAAVLADKLGVQEFISAEGGGVEPMVQLNFVTMLMSSVDGWWKAFFEKFQIVQR